MDITSQGGGKEFRLATNGAPSFIDLFKKTQVPESGSIELRCLIDSPNGKFNHPFNWSFEIVVPGGGIMPATGEFAFEAPEEGYTPSISVSMSKDSGRNWVAQFKQKYLMKFGNGKYGRMNLEFYTAQSPMCIIESFVNPTGSRNLEYDKAAQPLAEQD